MAAPAGKRDSDIPARKYDGRGGFDRLIEDLTKLRKKGQFAVYFHLIWLFPTVSHFPPILENIPDFGVTLKNLRKLCELLKYDASYATKPRRTELLKRIYFKDPRLKDDRIMSELQTVLSDKEAAELHGSGSDSDGGVNSFSRRHVSDVSDSEDDSSESADSNDSDDEDQEAEGEDEDDEEEAEGTDEDDDEEEEADCSDKHSSQLSAKGSKKSLHQQVNNWHVSEPPKQPKKSAKKHKEPSSAPPCPPPVPAPDDESCTPLLGSSSSGGYLSMRHADADGHEVASSLSAKHGHEVANPHVPNVPELKEGSKSKALGLAFSGGGIRSAYFQIGVLQQLAADEKTNEAAGKALERIRYVSSVSGGGYATSGWLSHLHNLKHSPDSIGDSQSVPIDDVDSSTAITLEDRRESIIALTRTVQGRRSDGRTVPGMQSSPAYFTADGVFQLAGMFCVSILTMVFHVATAAWFAVQCLSVFALPTFCTQLGLQYQAQSNGLHMCTSSVVSSHDVAAAPWSYFFECLLFSTAVLFLAPVSSALLTALLSPGYTDPCPTWIKGQRLEAYVNAITYYSRKLATWGQRVAAIVLPLLLFIWAVYSLQAFEIRGGSVWWLTGVGLAICIGTGFVAYLCLHLNFLPSVALPMLPTLLVLVLLYLLCFIVQLALFEGDSSGSSRMLTGIAVIWPVIWSFSWSRSEMFHHFYRIRLRNFFYADISSDSTSRFDPKPQEIDTARDKQDPYLRELYQYAYDSKTNPKGITFFFNTTLSCTSPSFRPSNVPFVTKKVSHRFPRDPADPTYVEPPPVKPLPNLFPLKEGPEIDDVNDEAPISINDTEKINKIKEQQHKLLETVKDQQSESTKSTKSDKEIHPFGSTTLSTAMAISGAAFAFSNGVFSFANSLSVQTLAHLLDVGLGSWVYNERWRQTFLGQNITGPMRLLFSAFTLLFTWYLPLLCVIYWNAKVGVLLFAITFLTLGFLMFVLQHSWLLLAPFWRAVSFFLQRIRASKLKEDPFLYLSDGGHLENLGLLELMEKRVPEIFAFDAGEDRALQLADLYNGLQLAAQYNLIHPDYTFLTSPSHMWQGRKKWPNISFSRTRVIRIDFKYRSPRKRKGISARLWYVKSTLTGKESDHILHLHKNQPTEAAFPHHPTINQVMDANRRDAYIRLGFESCKELLLQQELSKNDPEQTAGKDNRQRAKQDIRIDVKKEDVDSGEVSASASSFKAPKKLRRKKSGQELEAKSTAEVGSS